MIEEINRKQHKKFIGWLISFIVLSMIVFCLSLMIGQYGILNPIDLFKAIMNSFGNSFNVSQTTVNIVQYIRFPRTLAAFLIGGSLAISGLIYQNTFNNKLVSPDVLGVSAGACVGAGLAILWNFTGVSISLFAFAFGFIAVLISLLLPKIFRNKSTLTLVLSGIIVGSFMNSIIGLIKYLADKDDKLSAITFWMMGSVSGITLEEILYVLPLIIVCVIVLIIMNLRIDIISLGGEEAKSLGINYKINRLIIIICSTILTACSVSISGNVGWVGLVVPHIARTLVGPKSKFSLPISFLFGGIFMMIVDMISRNISRDEIPLSIITGVLGAIIYTIVLIKKGRNLSE